MWHKAKGNEYMNTKTKYNNKYATLDFQREYIVFRYVCKSAYSWIYWPLTEGVLLAKLHATALESIVNACSKPEIEMKTR